MPAHIQASPSKQAPRPRAKINSSAQLRVRTESSTPRPPQVRVRSPPLDSPPTSTLSFSSRSSLSTARSDDDLRTTLIAGPALRTATPALHTTLTAPAALPPDPKASAKSNRKIADLEITNRSLLAINASLESTKHKQAREIRDLRRRLRESRLVLPPPVLDDDDPAPTDHDDDNDNDNDDPHDEVFLRIRSMLDNLLHTARTALQTQPRDFLPEGPAKVLSADEVRSWTEQDEVLVHSSPPSIRISAKG